MPEVNNLSSSDVDITNDVFVFKENDISVLVRKPSDRRVLFKDEFENGNLTF